MARPAINPDDPLDTLAIRLPASLKEQLTDASWSLRLSKSEIVRRALSEWLERVVVPA